MNDDGLWEEMSNETLLLVEAVALVESLISGAKGELDSAAPNFARLIRLMQVAERAERRLSRRNGGPFYELPAYDAPAVRK